MNGQLRQSQQSLAQAIAGGVGKLFGGGQLRANAYDEETKRLYLQDTQAATRDKTLAEAQLKQRELQYTAPEAIARIAQGSHATPERQRSLADLIAFAGPAQAAAILKGVNERAYQSQAVDALAGGKLDRFNALSGLPTGKAYLPFNEGGGVTYSRSTGDVRQVTPVGETTQAKNRAAATASYGQAAAANALADERKANTRTGTIGAPAGYRYINPSNPDAGVRPISGYTPDTDSPSSADVAKLRGEFIKLAAPYVKSRDSFARLSASAVNPSAAGDLALIFNYMKILDPGSTVREGEFATAQNATGVDGRVRSYYNNIARGERLTDEQRTDFVNRAKLLMDEQDRSHKHLRSQYQALAGRLSIAPENVALDFVVSPGVGGQGTASATTVPVLTPGTQVPSPQAVSDVGPKFTIANGKTATVAQLQAFARENSMTLAKAIEVLGVQ